MTNREKLEALGRALYGHRWQNSVLRDIGINPRSFERMVAGVAPIPDGIISQIVGLAVSRRDDLSDAIERARQQRASDERKPNTRRPHAHR